MPKALTPQVTLLKQIIMLREDGLHAVLCPGHSIPLHTQQFPMGKLTSEPQPNPAASWKLKQHPVRDDCPNTQMQEGDTFNP